MFIITLLSRLQFCICTNFKIFNIIFKLLEPIVILFPEENLFLKYYFDSKFIQYLPSLKYISKSNISIFFNKLVSFAFLEAEFHQDYNQIKAMVFQLPGTTPLLYYYYVTFL